MLKYVDFEAAVLSEGRLFVRKKPGRSAHDLTVKSGATLSVLERIDATATPWEKIPFRRRFQIESENPVVFEQLEDGSRETFRGEVYVNALQDWALDNGKTLQLRIDGFQDSQTIAIDSSVLVPTNSKRRTVKALVGTHRCDARFVATFTPTKSGEAVTVRVPIERKFRGGRVADGYQRIAIDVPDQDQDVVASIQIEFIRYRQDGDDNYPYVFLANPEVVGEDAEALQIEPRFSGDLESTDGEWYAGHVPIFRSERDPGIKLGADKDAVELFVPIPNDVTLEDDYGHTLICRAREARTMMLYVDGKPLQPVHIGTEHTPIRMPSSCLRGEVVNVSIRDMSGSQIFLEMPVLAPRSLTPEDVILRETRRPYPTDLTVRANHRYQSLRAHIAHPIAGLDPASLQTAIEALDQNYDTVKLKPIAFPTVENPKVSVVIPAHNKVNVTYYGLCALLVAHNEASFEVIVVDDASIDETSTLENIVSGITVIHNEQAQRFIRACNAGVAAAKGEYVVLLNNDTEATRGWLDALLKVFDDFDDVGAVGSKLLYPNGLPQMMPPPS